MVVVEKLRERGNYERDTYHQFKNVASEREAGVYAEVGDIEHEKEHWHSRKNKRALQPCSGIAFEVSDKKFAETLEVENIVNHCF